MAEKGPDLAINVCNGWKWLYMAVHGCKCLEIPEMAGSGWKWLKQL